MQFQPGTHAPDVVPRMGLPITQRGQTQDLVQLGKPPPQTCILAGSVRESGFDRLA